MNNSESIENFWRECCADNPEINVNQPYEVWSFHNNSEGSKKLARLVLDGTKKATASLMEHETDDGDGGTIGGLSIVTDFEGVPHCVIQTTEVRRLPFNEVDAQFAFDEGEGDKSLRYWRDAHTRFFTECCEELNIEFNESMMVCCKRFKKLYPR